MFISIKKYEPRNGYILPIILMNYSKNKKKIKINTLRMCILNDRIKERQGKNISDCPKKNKCPFD